MTHRFLIADRGTHTAAVKTCKGRKMNHVATQLNPRKDRRGKDSYIYHREGTFEMYYNHNLNHAHFIPMGKYDHEMRKYATLFVSHRRNEIPRLVDWRERNGYTLLQNIYDPKVSL